MVAIQRLNRRKKPKSGLSLPVRFGIGVIVAYLIISMFTSSKAKDKAPVQDSGSPKLRNLKDTLEQSKQQQQKTMPQQGLRKDPSPPAQPDDNFAQVHKLQEKRNGLHDSDPDDERDGVLKTGDSHANSQPEIDDPQHPVDGISFVENHHEIDHEAEVEPDLPNEDGVDSSQIDDPLHVGQQQQKNVAPQEAVVAEQTSRIIQNVEAVPGAANFQKAVDRQGSGPTSVAYLKDFVHERQHPPFRTNVVDSKSMSDASDQMGVSSLIPCLTVSDDRKLLHDPQCKEDGSDELVAYNSAPFVRTWCGHHIASKEAIKMSEACNEPAPQILDTDFPPVDGQGASPIIIKSHKEEISSSDVEQVECNIPCKRETGMEGTKRYIDGKDWEITMTMADSARSNEAKIERTDFRRDLYYSTQSWKSSVPQTIFSFDKYSLRDTPILDWDATINKAIYLAQTDCAGSRRNKYVAAMRKALPVDAMGSCQHNANVPEGGDINSQSGRIDLMKQYRFVLAFDNMTEKDHISAPIWEALMSGALPIFLGADNARNHFPPKSVIFAGDFKDWDELAAHVKTVSEDKDSWESYQQWRTDDAAIQAFEDRYKFTTTSPECRLCRWAYAKQNGLGWDHASQEVTAPSLPRHMCTSETTSLVSKPFIEEWIFNDGETTENVKADTDDETSCSSTTSDGLVTSTSFDVQRTVIQHDGVTDIHLTSLASHSGTGDLILRLNFPTVHNQDGAYFANIHALVKSTNGPLMTSATIQDETSKVTVLANWATSIVSTTEGSIEVLAKSSGETIGSNEARYLRIITEDMSILHDKMTEAFPSSFARMMMADFIDPLELFRNAETQ
mmetsp:Transcript_17362/g.48934  ORF Transcript_17362/g.48934 Transcript_17362/m.48934 type:complete len:842 (-) Transcript_17362:163-2688(-)